MEKELNRLTVGTSHDAEARHRDRKTLDLLDELAKITGHGDIMLGRVDDVLTSAIGLIKNGESYRERLQGVHRDLGEITGMKYQGATISDMIAGIKLAFASIAPPALPRSSSYAAILLRGKDSTPFEHGPTEIPARPFYDRTTSRLRIILERSQALTAMIDDTIKAAGNGG